MLRGRQVATRFHCSGWCQKSSNVFYTTRPTSYYNQQLLSSLKWSRLDHCVGDLATKYNAQSLRRNLGTSAKKRASLKRGGKRKGADRVDPFEAKPSQMWYRKNEGSNSSSSGGGGGGGGGASSILSNEFFILGLFPILATGLVVAAREDLREQVIQNWTGDTNKKGK